MPARPQRLSPSSKLPIREIVVNSKIKRRITRFVVEPGPIECDAIRIIERIDRELGELAEKLRATGTIDGRWINHAALDLETGLTALKHAVNLSTSS